MSSDWKNWILDWSVFAAVAEVRGAGVGLGVTVDPAVVCEVGGLRESTETVRGGGGDGAGEELETLGGVLGLSVSHDGPSLEEEEVVLLLVLLGSLGLGVGWWVLLGNSLRGGHLSAGASDLTSQSELSLRSFNTHLNSSEEQLTLHSSGGKASHPPGGAAPGERACCRRRTCCSTSPSDWICQPERPRKREVPPSSGRNGRPVSEGHQKVT